MSSQVIGFSCTLHFFHPEMVQDTPLPSVDGIIFYQAICWWERDYILRDILPEFGHWSLQNFDSASELSQVAATLVKETGTSHQQFSIIIVFNDESIEDMLRVIDLLRPRVLIQLSDEWGQHPEMLDLADRVPLFLRQHRFLHYPFKPNLFQIPLGYMTGMLNGTSALQRSDIPQISARTKDWVFVGTLKQDRSAMIEAFSSGLNRSYYVSHSAAAPEMFEVYKTTIFAPNGRGNVVLDCFRLYEASLAGAIPVVVGSWDEIKGGFYFDGDMPPWIFEPDWESAVNRCADMLPNLDALQALQDHNLQWWERQVHRARMRIRSAIAYES